MMAATVVPVGDCSIAMTRACFEPALALLVLGSSANCREGFTALADNGDFAGDGFLADFDIEILDSVSRRRRAAPPKPRIGDKAGGAGSRSALAPKSDDSTAPIAVECQSFLQAVTTQFSDLQSRDIARHGIGTQTGTAYLSGPLAAPACSPATKSSLSTARRTTAAAILQKVLQILPPIVVGNFLARLDAAQSHNYDPAPAPHRSARPRRHCVAAERNRSGRILVRQTNTRETNNAIRPAANVPRPLAPNERGRLGQNPPRAAGTRPIAPGC